MLSNIDFINEIRANTEKMRELWSNGVSNNTETEDIEALVDGFINMANNVARLPPHLGEVHKVQIQLLKVVESDLKKYGHNFLSYNIGLCVKMLEKCLKDNLHFSLH